MARLLYVLASTVLVMSHAAYAGSLPPLTLPTFSLPNATALLDGAKDSIRATATAALLDHLAFKPKLCSNGLPVVTCLWDVCEGKCGGAGQICVPDYCGACNAKCVDMTAPSPKSITLPKLSTLSLKVPNITLPKAPCAKNEAFNVSAMVTSLYAKNPRIACKACPEGTVALPGALACTICPPGFYADRALGKCTICGAGTYNAKAGSSTCEPCPIGQFMPLYGSFACIKCPVGFNAPKIGAAKCDFVGFAAKSA